MYFNLHLYFTLSLVCESVKERLWMLDTSVGKVKFYTKFKLFRHYFFFSLSARSEHLEYPCANFVQTPIDSKRTSAVLCCNDCDNDLEKMTIKCHYNPIMDEYLRCKYTNTNTQIGIQQCKYTRLERCIGIIASLDRLLTTIRKHR